MSCHLKPSQRPVAATTTTTTTRHALVAKRQRLSSARLKQTSSNALLFLEGCLSVCSSDYLGAFLFLFLTRASATYLGTHLRSRQSKCRQQTIEERAAAAPGDSFSDQRQRQRPKIRVHSAVASDLLPAVADGGTIVFAVLPQLSRAAPLSLLSDSQLRALILLLSLLVGRASGGRWLVEKLNSSLAH